MKRLFFWAACLAIAKMPILQAQEKALNVTIAADQADFRSTPITIPLSLPRNVAAFTYARIEVNGKSWEGQVTAPSIMTESIGPSAKGLVRRDLHWVVPFLKKGEKLALTATVCALGEGSDPRALQWRMEKGEPTECFWSIVASALEPGQQRPLLRYMNASFDESSMDARDRTYKVFHHLYAPDGKRFVTNGGQTDLKPGENRKLLFPHHRGIMFGFNKCSYGDGLKKKADTWHCTGDAHLAHEKTLSYESGGVLGRHRVQIGWHGEKKERFAVEERELTVYKLPGGTLIEFASRLRTTGGPVKLDGDPQHAGFQFRASNDVAEKTAKQTYYLRPDGKGELGATRNWDPKTRQGPVDLPWYAMSFVLDGKRYTCCYLNHPSNPKETRFSERDYGRFGGYFEYNVTETTPLVVNYRLWLQDGEMTGEQAAALHAAFAAGVKGMMK